MLKALKASLPNAEGRSEFVIAVFCDIRGFTVFGAANESPNLGQFIKLFYTKLLADYFPTARFAKPTGDGLLLIFNYTPKTLHNVAHSVIESCSKAVIDFPKFFTNEPMINFSTPCNLAFGIARGTACCLFSGKRIIDYSGKLLNLAARLNDLARPRGIILDGAFQIDILPKQISERYKNFSVYLRGVAEEEPIPIYCSEEIELTYSALTPYSSRDWIRDTLTLTAKEGLALTSRLRMLLKQDILSKEHVKIFLVHDSPKLAGYHTRNTIDDYKIVRDADGTQLVIATEQIQKVIKDYQLKPKCMLKVECQYIPKPICQATKPTPSRPKK